MSRSFQVNLIFARSLKCLGLQTFALMLHANTPLNQIIPLRYLPLRNGYTDSMLLSQLNEQTRIKCGEDDLRGHAILGNINEKNIRTHAPQEVRKEESRLKDLSAATLERAKNDLKWYLDLTRDGFD
ncbi:hypothetical protein B0H11DRAFT_1931539 [Mycena galericulata]|nr:hypothetical protein B0H11DRAFT_1931539 [Mycena galericulata]